jgi:hypothetical protein
MNDPKTHAHQVNGTKLPKASNPGYPVNNGKFWLGLERCLRNPWEMLEYLGA